MIRNHGTPSKVECYRPLAGQTSYLPREEQLPNGQYVYGRKDFEILWASLGLNEVTLVE
ncbi:hypothetical protein ACT3UE_11010 [Arthrobacter sp. 179]